jgi:PIN domain nuclease of toxin-antitoxin system
MTSTPRCRRTFCRRLKANENSAGYLRIPLARVRRRQIVRGSVSAAIRDPNNQVFLSAVSFWEISLKHSLGKLPLPQSPAQFIPQQREKHLIAPLALDEAAVAQLGGLPALHRDPFDRMLVRHGSCGWRTRAAVNRRSPDAGAIAGRLTDHAKRLDCGGFSTALLSDKYDVFLSHSAKDKAVVRPLAERLRQDGLKVWFDEWVLKPGDSIPAKIEEGLEHSRVLVLCMSANAFGSDWAQLEAGTFRFRDPLTRRIRENCTTRSRTASGWRRPRPCCWWRDFGCCPITATGRRCGRCWIFAISLNPTRSGRSRP